MIWHILDVRAVWIKEFTAALSAQVDTLGWCPQITGTGMFRDSESETQLSNPELRVRYFPLQRGFAKFPINLIAREAERVSRRMLKRTERPADSVLVCTSPHYAPVAERWPGSRGLLRDGSFYRLRRQSGIRDRARPANVQSRGPGLSQF
jgi:hypothetical protein